jgi:hypothetical protein
LPLATDYRYIAPKAALYCGQLRDSAMHQQRFSVRLLWLTPVRAR